jgi:hypothetical protein
MQNKVNSTSSTRRRKFSGAPSFEIQAAPFLKNKKKRIGEHYSAKE